MKKLAFIFPGQGSQSVGMGKALHEAYPVASEVFDEADEALGFSLKKIIFDGPVELLNRTENTQPALLATSIAALRVLRENLDIEEPGFVAGHSLGEYTALVAAGAMEFKDALRVVHLRGRYMQESVPEGVGMMCAVVGADVEKVIEICADACEGDEIAVPANINTPEQLVVSGHTGAVQRAARMAKECGARKVVELAVSVPSHSPLMAGAAEKLGAELSGIELSEPSVPLLSNVEASPVTDAARIKELLKRQLTSPVMWVDIIKRLKQEGVDATVEIGPGRVLSGLVRRIESGMETYNFGEPGDLEKLKGLLHIP